MKKSKKPHPPRCLCNSWLHWAFGIVSPSKYYRYKFTWKQEEHNKVKRYFAALQDYEEYVFMQRLNARSVTKEEWKRHYRQQRHIARQMKANESFRESMQKLQDAARKMGEEIAAAAKEINEQNKIGGNQNENH